MLTPQEVSSHAFPKAVMGGYNMSSVDEFLDELTDDYTTLYKENMALKAKLKVLVEKVEDYRSTEDSMRATLLTAQKMADSIVREAEAKRDAILSGAELDAEERVARLQEQEEIAAARLRAGQQELANFIAAVRDVCGRELAALDLLPELPVELPKAAAEVPEAAPTAQEIENSIMAELEAAAAAELEAAEKAAESAAEYPEGDPFVMDVEEEEEEDEQPTRRIDLSELKFGRNYGKD